MPPIQSSSPLLAFRTPTGEYSWVGLRICTIAPLERAYFQMSRVHQRAYFQFGASHSVQRISTVSIALLHLSLLYCCSRQGMRCVPQFAVGREACDIVRKSCTRHVGHASSIIAFSRFYLFCCALPSALILCLAGCCISHAGCVLFATRH